MKHIKYRFSIDDDVINHYEIKVPVQIAFEIMVYLNDPDGWSKYGYFFEPVTNGEKLLIRMSSKTTIQNLCGDGSLSCAELGGRIMYLNAWRWFHGSTKSKLKLDDYRQYVISHEIGHVLGYEHEECPCKGCNAPIMMQQTRGIGQCNSNTSV